MNQLLYLKTVANYLNNSTDPNYYQTEASMTLAALPTNFIICNINKIVRKTLHVITCLDIFCGV